MRQSQSASPAFPCCSFQHFLSSPRLHLTSCRGLKRGWQALAMLQAHWPCQGLQDGSEQTVLSRLSGTEPACRSHQRLWAADAGSHHECSDLLVPGAPPLPGPGLQAPAGRLRTVRALQCTHPERPCGLPMPQQSPPGSCVPSVEEPGCHVQSPQDGLLSLHRELEY